MFHAAPAFKCSAQRGLLTRNEAYVRSLDPISTTAALSAARLGGASPFCSLHISCAVASPAVSVAPISGFEKQSSEN